MKTKFSCLDAQGQLHKIEGGRLETTMQNIADYIVDKTSQQLAPEKFDQLKTFIMFNERRKTISVTKASYQPGQSPFGTPEGCFYELMQNQEELLVQNCKMKIPPISLQENFILEGPPFLFLYHPALGPLYHVIGQKIQGGSFAFGSEMQLEIAELEMIDVNIDGTLRIIADHVMGEKNGEEHQVYSNLTGKCRLKNIFVKNRGIDRSASNVYWKNQVKRKEELHIWLRGNAEFIAEDCVFEGNVAIEVPDKHRMTARMDRQGKIVYSLEKIEHPSWYWKYHFDEEDRVRVRLEKES